MVVRNVEWKLPYTWGKAITVNPNTKVISLNLRDENNLIIYDSWDNEIYVDLQLPDWILPNYAFPVWITTGRVLVADGWDVTGTIIVAKTTSWDVIKLVYWDNWKLFIDNWSWLFKQIYLAPEVDALLATKQDVLIAWENITIGADGRTISATMPAMSRFLSLWDCATGEPISFPGSIPFEYRTWDHYLVENVSTATPAVNYRPSWNAYDWTPSTAVETSTPEIWDVYFYDGTVWLLQKNSDKSVSFANIVWQPSDNAALDTALNSKQATLVSWTNIKTVNNQSLLWSWNLQIDGWVTSVNSQTWAVVLDADDISDTNTTNKFVTAAEKSWWSSKQNQFFTSSSTAPSSPSEWDQWYDTANDKLKVYDGTSWVEVWTWGSGGSTIEYVTQSEYTALLPGALTDNKHYFIYSTWGGWGWQPGANTLLYLPLNSTDTYTDQSWNNISTTNTNVTFWTYQGVDCWQFNQAHIQVNTMFAQPIDQTILCWCYNTWVEDSGRDGKIYDARDGSNYIILNYNVEWGRGYSGVYNGNSFSNNWNYQNQWILVALVCTSNSLTRYVKNGTYDLNQSITISKSQFTPTYINVWNEWDNWVWRYFIGWLSELIVESKARTAQEIADYYNSTKANYWIS